MAVTYINWSCLIRDNSLDLFLRNETVFLRDIMVGLQQLGRFWMLVTGYYEEILLLLVTSLLWLPCTGYAELLISSIKLKSQIPGSNLMYKRYH